jgi:hypothetical protein
VFCVVAVLATGSCCTTDGRCARAQGDELVRRAPPAASAEAGEAARLLADPASTARCYGLLRRLEALLGGSCADAGGWSDVAPAATEAAAFGAWLGDARRRAGLAAGAPRAPRASWASRLSRMLRRCWRGARSAVADAPVAPAAAPLVRDVARQLRAPLAGAAAALRGRGGPGVAAALTAVMLASGPGADGELATAELELATAAVVLEAAECRAAARRRAEAWASLALGVVRGAAALLRAGEGAGLSTDIVDVAQAASAAAALAAGTGAGAAAAAGGAEVLALERAAERIAGALKASGHPDVLAGTTAALLLERGGEAWAAPERGWATATVALHWRRLGDAAFAAAAAALLRPLGPIADALADSC